ncbi:RNF14, partial [Symbiodinium microadriaticum]
MPSREDAEAEVGAVIAREAVQVVVVAVVVADVFSLILHHDQIIFTNKPTRVIVTLYQELLDLLAYVRSVSLAGDSQGCLNIHLRVESLHPYSATHNWLKTRMVAEVIGRVDRLCPLDVREHLLASFREPQHLKFLAVWNRFCGVGIGMSSRTENPSHLFVSSVLRRLGLDERAERHPESKRQQLLSTPGMSHHVQDAGRRFHVDNGACGATPRPPSEGDLAWGPTVPAAPGGSGLRSRTRRKAFETDVPGSLPGDLGRGDSRGEAAGRYEATGSWPARSANFLLLLRRLLWKSSRVSPEQSSDPDAQILLNLQQDAASTYSPWEGLTFNSLCPKMAPAHASFKQAIAAVFKQLIVQGMAPNEAAVEAIRRVRSESDAQKRPAAVHSQAHMRDSVDESSLEVDCPGGPYTCFICTEAKDASERFLPHRCPEMPESLCCKPCFVAWVESQIDADSPNIKCCHCDTELSNRTLQYLVDAAHWQRYCDSALQRSLKRDANFIWCSKCGGGGWVDPTQPTSKCGWNCPLCDNSFVYCPLCRRDHGSVSCKRFHKLRKEVVLGKQQAQDRDSAGVVQRSSKSCPSCKMPIQKDGGCNYMDCPNCRRHFCWSCGQIMKSSHQKHKCDAGFEASGVVGKTTQGRPCVELTRLFMNVIDIDSVEVMNVDDDDVQDCKDMLVPSADQEAKSPLFVGPSQMDGEILLRLPFNFTSAISWEVTHIHLRATHPPAPNCCRPKSLGLLANSPSATFSDFDDSTAVTVNLE